MNKGTVSVSCEGKHSTAGSIEAPRVPVRRRRKEPVPPASTSRDRLLTGPAATRAGRTPRRRRRRRRQPARRAAAGAAAAAAPTAMPRVELAPGPVQRGKLLWTWDGVITRGFPLGRFPARMAVAGYPLPEGRTGLVVVSPLEPTDEVVAWLRQAGEVCFVVAPNKCHHWWAPALKAEFPAALLVAPLGLALQRRGRLPVDVRVTPLAGSQDLPGAWPSEHIDLVPLRGLPLLDELALLHRPSSTLLLTDAAFNFDAECLAALRPGPLLRAYLSAAAGRRRCCMTRPFRLLIQDAGALRDSFDQMLAEWEWEQVCVAHGSFIAGGGKQAFLEGSYAFVDELARSGQQRQQHGGGGGGGLVGAGAAFLVAAAVIGTAVGVGVAGILQAWQH